MHMTKPLRIAAIVLILPGLGACQSTGDTYSGYKQFAGAYEGKSETEIQNAAAAEGMIPAIVGLPPEPGDRATYRIGPYDLLQVDVFQADELSRKYRVSEDGRIGMPLIGAVQIGGLTPQEAQDRIAEALGRNYLQDPQVSVFVEEFASHNVTVAGAVRRPGVYPLKTKTTLLEAVALAEGVNEVADDDHVILFRHLGGEAIQAYVIDLEAIHKGKLRDPRLIADDRVVVPESGGLVFLRTVTGTVRGFIRPIGF